MTKTTIHMESLLALALVNSVPTEEERMRVLRVLQDMVREMLEQ